MEFTKEKYKALYEESLAYAEKTQEYLVKQYKKTGMKEFMIAGIILQGMSDYVSKE